MKVAKIVLVAGLLCVLTSAGVQAQDTLNVSLTGRWAFGPKRAVTMWDGADLMYVGNGGYFQAWDLTSHTDPDSLGEIGLPEPLNDIALDTSSDVAFIADGTSGLRVIDIASFPLTEIGFVDTDGFAWGVAYNIDSSRVYVADGTNGLRVIDVSTFSAPVEVGFHLTGGMARSIDFWRTSGASDTDHVAIAYQDPDVANNRVVRIFDVTDPTAITQEDIFYGVSRPYDIVYDGSQYVYLADSTGLRVLDVSNPTSVTEADYIHTQGTAVGVALDMPNVAFVADRDYAYGVQQFDISTPTAVARNDSAVTNGNAVAVGTDAADSYVYVMCGLRGFHNFDYSGAMAGDYSDDPSWGQVRDVVVLGDTAYVSDFNDGLRKIDISTPSAPVFHSQNLADFTTNQPYGLDIAGNYLYVANEGTGILVFHVADITTQVGMYNTDGRALNIDVSGDYAYIADERNGLVILDVTDPLNPALEGSFDSFDHADDVIQDVTVWGDYAFVAVAYKGLWIIDVSTPSSPTEAGHVMFAGDVNAVAINVMGEYAYVADGQDGLQVIDVRNRSFPSVVATLDTDGRAFDVALSGNHAFVADGTNGMRLINIFDPTNPQEVGYYNTGDVAYNVHVQGYNAYLGDNEDGLYIFDNTLAHASHFTTSNGYDIVSPTGRSVPVVIMNAQILGKDPQGFEAGDEIAVCDGDTIVGVGVYEGRFPISITAWLRYVYDGTVLPGAWTGNKMIFKIWNQSSGDDLPAIPTYTYGDGTFTEAQFLTVVNPLTAYQLGGFESHGDTLVDPTGFSQNVIVQNVLVNGNPIAVGDEIGVYDGILLVGAGEWQGSALTIAVWLETTLPNSVVLPGAILGNAMSFKVWQASNDSLFQARPTYAPGSLGQFSISTVTVTLLEAFAYDRQEIMVRPNRLNLISFNVQPPDTIDQEIAVMLDDIVSLVVAQNDLGQFFLPGAGIDQIGRTDLTKGYQLYYSAADSDTVINEGFVLLPQNQTVALTNTRFYMIGYPYWTAQLAINVFSSITSLILVLQDDNGFVWVPSYSINTIDQNGGMQPGKGYTIFVTQSINYTFPALAGGMAKLKPSKEGAEPATPVYFTFKETGLPYTVIFEGSDTDLMQGDEVGLFAGNMCVGAAVFEGSYPFVIPAWGEVDMAGLQLEGFRKDQPISVNVWSQGDQEAIKVPITSKDGETPRFGKGAIGVIRIGEFDRTESVPTEYGLDQNYPNPFNPETTIRYQLPEAVNVRLTVYNTMGQAIRTLVNADQQAGKYTVDWDGRNEAGVLVGSGIYFLRMEAGNFQKIQKMTLIQ